MFITGNSSLKYFHLFLLLLPIAVVSCDGSSSDSDNGSKIGAPIEVRTVSGLTFSLEGTFTSTCYQTKSESQIDELTVSGELWTNTQKHYSDDACQNLEEESSLTGKLSKTSGNNDVTLTGWYENDVPDAADGSGPLADDEQVTLLNLEITGKTGKTFDGVDIGFSTKIFYVVDDTKGKLLYRHFYADVDKEEYIASSSDPLFLNQE